MTLFTWVMMVMFGLEFIFKAYMLATKEYPRKDEIRASRDVLAMCVNVGVAFWAILILWR